MCGRMGREWEGEVASKKCPWGYMLERTRVLLLLLRLAVGYSTRVATLLSFTSFSFSSPFDVVGK